MKYFFKLDILKNNKKQATHYFIPDVIANVKERDGYLVAAHLINGNYSFNVTKDGNTLGEYSNKINPDEPVSISDGEYSLLFSLVSVKFNKRKVEAYLKKRPDTKVKDMNEFYSFIEEEKSRSKHPYQSTGPLYSTSGMDPDLRAEYASGGPDREREEDNFNPCFNLKISSEDFEELSSKRSGLNSAGDTFHSKQVTGSDIIDAFSCDFYITNEKLAMTLHVVFKDREREDVFAFRDAEIGYMFEKDYTLEHAGQKTTIHVSFEYLLKQ